MGKYIFTVPDRRETMFFGLPPWLFAGVSAVLGLAVLFLAVRNAERERQHVTMNVLDRADALIWALEAGARTGMGFEREQTLLQALIEESARQPDIVYMAVIRPDGRVIAHSEAGQVGTVIDKTRLPREAPTEAPTCRIAEGREDALLEVYRGFAPLRGGRGGHSMGHGMGRRMDRAPQAPAAMRQEAAASYAFVGFDRQPFTAALSADRWNSALSAGLAAGLGCAAYISLFWAHSYRRSRRKLKDTQAMASEVVTSLPLGLISSDPQGAVVMLNAAALSMLRLEAENTAAMALRDVPGLDWDRLALALDRNKKMPEREAELLFADGKKTPVSISGSLLRDSEGAVIGRLFIVRDIADMKRLQREARQNERLTALGALAAGVAHEIRNPLSSIKGLATYIAQKLRNAAGPQAAPSPEEEAAKTMVREVDRLNRVVSELLEFARPGVLEPVPTDLNGVVARALRLAEADSKAGAIRVSFTPDPAFASVPVDAERLTQALLNLFLNAVQAMEPGGELRVRLEGRPDNEVAILIADTGRGMTPEVLASIFTPYFTTKASGTGLGLALAQRIIEGHGGGVTVTSEPGKGSVFTLTLPLRATPGEQL